MGYFAVLLIAFGLAMDALAVSVTNGIITTDYKKSHGLKQGMFFGVFQSVMPLIGFALGSGFESLIKSFDHWVAFGLLFVIGANMIIETFKEEETQSMGKSAADVFGVKNLTLQAVATSIDALAVGISFAVAGEGNIFISSLIIGAVAFLLSYCGGMFGVKIGELFQKSASRVGGVILIAIGIKILIEHMLG